MANKAYVSGTSCIRGERSIAPLGCSRHVFQPASGLSFLSLQFRHDQPTAFTGIAATLFTSLSLKKQFLSKLKGRLSSQKITSISCIITRSFPCN